MQAASEWKALLQTLPQATLTPVLWPDDERQQLLRGSPVLQVGHVLACFLKPANPVVCFAYRACTAKLLQEARSREQALRQEWQSIAATIAQADGGVAAYPEAAYNEQAFMEVTPFLLKHQQFEVLLLACGHCLLCRPCPWC